jgi:hypothetical protein
VAILPRKERPIYLVRGMNGEYNWSGRIFNGFRRRSPQIPQIMQIAQMGKSLCEESGNHEGFTPGDAEVAEEDRSFQSSGLIIRA